MAFVLPSKGILQSQALKKVSLPFCPSSALLMCDCLCTNQPLIWSDI